ncbi:D-arabinono-1,4-lactone oxidase [Herbiconiux sp. KACC 21604]|uniref:D-arabinono-1,4-lactone oxidase n=1 Tax=unclassified Herbiconiux TaxID=2618217 RepID=UPI001492E2C1|nr:D-arabinono-1,4-lactone oxidase [Herbiconiux sp. SALV-R1]QJU55290.1 FAD-binding protein [Herbiconiux sp. SALV-R1]WPO86457.1 D-arabinono-1,4-lactone oxidase [Herbiconiux sp. KACC 21604]
MPTKSQHTNWAGTYTYAFDAIEQPTTVDDLQQIVADAESLTVVGSRHSFSGITDGRRAVASPVDLETVSVSADRSTVDAPAGITYGSLASVLHREGLALHNLASLPHISIAGAIATATHGSGRANGNLATAVVGLQLVLADGSLLEVDEDHPDFAGMVVHLGALGVVTRVRLRVEPEFEVEQRVYENVPWDSVLANFDELMDAAYSVSIFTDRAQATTQLWLKQRTDRAALPLAVLGHATATEHLHPLPGFDAINCTRQLGIPGLWSERLPHFRMDFTPSNGEELQSEFHLPAASAPEAVRALLPLRDQLSSVLQDWELRAVAADTLWLSPQYERETVAVHMTWDPDTARVSRAVELVERALADFEPRPHWGKVFSESSRPAASLYPRFEDFLSLRQRLDPHGTFLNPWLIANVLGAEGR